MASEQSFSYIIVGGGTAGCALASRLQEKLKTPNSIAIIDRGLNAYDHEWIQNPLMAPRLKGSELQTHYRTVPQAALADRSIVNIGGNVLSGKRDTSLMGGLILIRLSKRYLSC